MATLTARLEEAKAALHDLRIGKSVVRVRDANGDEITYTRANRDDLKAYIKELEDEIAGTVACRPAPMRVFF